MRILPPGAFDDPIRRVDVLRVPPVNDTNVVVAVVSFGNESCKGVDYSARIDVADIQGFLAGFVDLAPRIGHRERPKLSSSKK